MASTDSGSGATPWLAFFIGALIVAVAVLGFFMFTGGHIPFGQSGPGNVNVTVKAPAIPSH